MLRKRPRLSALVIALAAITGTVSMAEASSACSTSVQVNAPRSCCAQRKVMTSCGCCEREPAETRVASWAIATIATSPYHANQGVSPCECRLDEGPSPGSRPSASTQTDRDDRTEVDNDALTAVVVVSPPLLARDALHHRDGVAWPIPVYLRTSRLLI